MSKAPAAPSGTVAMSLVIDTRAQRVLFAEAGKEATDFILGILALPIGTIGDLLADQLGSVANLIQSVFILDGQLECDVAWKALLPFHDDNDSQERFFSPPAPIAVEDLLSPPEYTCRKCCTGRGDQRGYVSAASGYTIMDDLTVRPASSTLLRNLGVKDLTGIEERTLSIGPNQGLEIINAALRSKTVLTDVFLPTKKRARTEDGNAPGSS